MSARNTAKFERVNRGAMGLLDGLKRVVTGSYGKDAGASLGTGLIEMHEKKPKSNPKRVKAK